VDSASERRILLGPDGIKQTAMGKLRNQMPDRRRCLRSPRGRLLLILILLGGVSVWLLVAGGPTSADIHRIVHRAGWLAPVAFVMIYVGLTVLLFPAVVATLAGGALFGVVAGSLITLVAAVLGATIAFAIGQRLGQADVQRLIGGRAARLEEWMRQRGFVALLYARLVPIVPFNLLNYAAGMAGMSLRSYVAATAIGIIPGTVAYTALGSTAGHSGSLPFIIALAAVTILTVVLALISRKHQRSVAEQRANGEMSIPAEP